MYSLETATKRYFLESLLSYERLAGEEEERLTEYGLDEEERQEIIDRIETYRELADGVRAYLTEEE